MFREVLYFFFAGLLSCTLFSFVLRVGLTVCVYSFIRHILRNETRKLLLFLCSFTMYFLWGVLSRVSGSSLSPFQAVIIIHRGELSSLARIRLCHVFHQLGFRKSLSGSWWFPFR